MRQTIKQPTLYLRSGYFIDNLKHTSGLGFEQLEKRIRNNQYRSEEKELGQPAPAFETVRDYFRLYRSVAFEPDRKAHVAPWLLAAELEFPGSSLAFFHPIFDLLFGELESSAFWSARFSKIPQGWIDQARGRGDERIAQEWEFMNQSTERRAYRSKPRNKIDTLSFVHLSLLRLPHAIRDVLFDGNGSAPNWTRKYSSAKVEIEHLQSNRNMESLAALLALMMESAETGDTNRFKLSGKALFNQLPFIDTHPGCARISNLLRELLVHKAAELHPREYNGFLHFGFGLPVSWRAMELEKFLPKPPSPKTK